MSWTLFTFSSAVCNLSVLRRSDNKGPSIGTQATYRVPTRIDVCTRSTPVWCTIL